MKNMYFVSVVVNGFLSKRNVFITIHFSKPEEIPDKIEQEIMNRFDCSAISYNIENISLIHSSEFK